MKGETEGENLGFRAGEPRGELGWWQDQQGEKEIKKTGGYHVFVWLPGFKSKSDFIYTAHFRNGMQRNVLYRNIFLF